MVLKHVANGAHFFVELAAPAHAERFGHRDLDARHVRRIPDRLEKRVREPEIQQVLNGFLSQEVIDAIDGVFGKRLVERRVERPRRREVAPERLLDDQARLVRHARPREGRRHHAKEAGRDGQVEHRPFGSRHGVAQARESRFVVVVAEDIRQPRDEAVIRCRIDAAVIGEAVADPVAQPAEAPFLTCNRDDRDLQLVAFGHRLQRRKDLLIRQVAGGPEQHERVGSLGRHG